MSADWTVHITLGGYDPHEHHRAYVSAADWLEEWAADNADDVEWDELLDGPGGGIDVTMRITGLQGAADLLSEGLDGFIATVEQAGMRPLAVRMTGPEGTTGHYAL